jgi:serine phosphatase RsbU (regulator of sigma subunit)
MIADLYQQLFFTTLAVAFLVLHGMLYLFNRRDKSNLYFTLFLFFYALTIFFDFQSSMPNQGLRNMTFLRIHRAVMPANPAFMVLFVYSVFETGIPGHFWLIAAGLAVTGALAVAEPVRNFGYMHIFLFAAMIEMVRVIRAAVRGKKDDARIIAAGFGLLLVFTLYDALMDANLIGAFHGIRNGYPFGFVCLIVSISIFLARDFARKNETILIQERKAKKDEIQRCLLEAESARQSRELEEARRLQLSMLPACVPEINGIKICFSMKTAAEVGGDYYDYRAEEDGTLTVAVGDATGHGMKAGILVSIVKGLFITHTAGSHMPDFFNECSRTLRQMRLGNLYMAMMLVKIRDGKLTASAAGMPPVLIYRASNGSVDELEIKGIPLGAVESYPYQTMETNLAAGDAVLMMTDGLPELFNERDESFDYPRVKEAFRKTAVLTPDEITDGLFAEADRWRGSRKQDDDMTFVVLKPSR